MTAKTATQKTNPAEAIEQCPSCTPSTSKEINCPVDATLRLIGGKYKSVILWQLIDKTLRHGELQRLIPQATPKMLTQQLRELESDNLVTRTIYPVVPPKVEYSLTDLGKSMQPLLYAMYDWGADYMKGNGQEICCSMKR
jgi:DNA-binding HxlR family transcriptional regulator